MAKKDLKRNNLNYELVHFKSRYHPLVVALRARMLNPDSAGKRSVNVLCNVCLGEELWNGGVCARLVLSWIGSPVPIRDLFSLGANSPPDSPQCVFV